MIKRGLIANAGQPRMPIEAFKQKGLDVLLDRRGRRRKADQRRIKRAHFLDARDVRLGDAPLALGDCVLDEMGDQPAHEFMNEARGLKARVQRRDLFANCAQVIDRGDVVQRDQSGAKAIVDVMRIIGDVVGESRRLRLGAGEKVKLEVGDRVIFDKRRRQPAAGIAGHRRAIRPQQRAIVLYQPFQRLECQIKAIEGGVTLLQLGDDAKRLRIVIEAAIGPHDVVKRVFARVAEGRMAEIMGERDGFSEIVVKAERPRQRARDLAHFQRMGQPRAVVVAVMGDEDLRLMGEPPEGGAMDDAVAVALKCRAGRRGGLGDEPAPATRRIRRVWGARAEIR